MVPFTNLSGSSERDYFIEGLVVDITVALGRESWLFVIAGASAQVVKDHATNLSEVSSKLGVRYVLKGSVRIESGDVIFVAQLSDALRGVQIWSERFRDKIDNVFALQERLTTKVAASIAPALISFEIDRALHKPTENLTAFDRYLRALPRFRSSRPENLAALRLLYEAIELDPNYATAHAMAARCYQFQQLFDWGSPDDPEFQEAIRLAHRAVDIGKNDSEALWMAGLALVQLGGEIDHGIAQIERSLAINPNSANAWTASCFARSYLGDTAPRSIISRRLSASIRWTFRSMSIGTPSHGPTWKRTDRGRAQRRGADPQRAASLFARLKNQDEHVWLARPHGRSSRMRREGTRSTADLHRGLDEQSP